MIKMDKTNDICRHIVFSLVLFAVITSLIVSMIVVANESTEQTTDPVCSETLYRYRKKEYATTYTYSIDSIGYSDWEVYRTESTKQYLKTHYDIVQYDLPYWREYYSSPNYLLELAEQVEPGSYGYAYNTRKDGTGHNIYSAYWLGYEHGDRTIGTEIQYGDYGTIYYIGTVPQIYNIYVYLTTKYYLCKWGEWSEWSEVPVEANDEIQVETKPGKRIYYHANGGYDAPSSVVIGLDDSFIITTNIPIRENHRFLGWSTSTLGGVEYLPGDMCLPSDAATLYAVWDFIGMISVETMPRKTQYFIGESLDTTGLVVLFYREDDTQQIIKEGYTVTGFDSVTPGSKAVTVSYQNYTTIFHVSVAEQGLCGGNLVWIYDGEGTLTISGNGSMGNYSATDIPWYNYHASIKTIVLGSGVTNLGNYAFYNCDNLTDIIIPDGVTRIGNSAFSFCEKLANITIGKGVKIIGSNAFSNCTSLTSITIPNNITSVGSYAFSNCYNLIGITIPDSVTSIDYCAFKNCSKLIDVTIGNGITSIGSDVFSGCSSLVNMTIPFVGKEISGSYGKPFGYLFGTSEYTGGLDITQVYYESIHSSSTTKKTYFIPSTLKSVTVTGGYIPYGAFYNCNKITEITIGNNVTGIGSKAFYECTGLLNITIGTGITHIEDDAFYNCYPLKNVYISDMKTWCDITFSNYRANPLYYAEYLYLNNKLVTDIIIPDGVRYIKSNTFYGYDNLATVGIPVSVAEIGDTAFYLCSNFTEVYYAGTEEQWKQITVGSSNTSLNNAFIEYNYNLSSLGHSHRYGNWTLISSPTFISNGLKEQVCIICGETATETLDLLVGKVAKWNITLNDDFRLNFYLEISNEIESTAKVKLMIGDNVMTHRVSSLLKNKEGKYILSANISAAQMNDYIVIMVMNGGDIGSTATYSVRQYCNTILADAAHSEYHTLVKEMLNYGAMAQIYFDYDTEYPANDGITGVANAEVPETTDEMIISDKITGLNFYGASLVFRDRIAVRYYFTGDVTGCTFTANGNTYTPVAKDGMYYVEIPDILPQNIDQQITLTVTNAVGDTLSVAYSPMNYIVRMNAKGSENLKNLLKALYNYHLAAQNLQSV